VSSAGELVELLEELIRIESVNPGLDPTGSGEAAIAEFVTDWGRRAGLDVEILEPTPGRPSAVLRGGRAAGGRRLLLCAHLDTVGLAANRDALTPHIDGDRLYGRGAYDMKAGLAAALIACRDAVATGIDGELVLAAVADEEHSSLGVQQVLARLDPSSIDAAVVTEPTERNIGTAHRGFIWTEIDIAGVAAHGSRPHLGADAILAAGPYLTALAELDRQLQGRPHDFLGPGNLHASLIRGGTEESTIPDRCVLTVERRTLPGETVAELEADIADILTRCRPADERITVTTRTTLHRHAMLTPPDSDIVTTILDAAGPGTEIAPLSYWADSAFLSGAGIPTVLYGPEGDGAHADVEWVSISGTRTVTDVLTRVATQFC
jgi:acetylornithine deacetylase